MLKHLLRDSFIFLASVSGASYVYRRAAHGGPRVRVVVFHDVPDATWFESMVVTLKNSYHVVSPRDFYAGALNTEKINVLITFDDGYDSWTTVALPILQKYNVKALFFVSSGLLDVASDAERVATFMREQLHIRPRRAITWDGVRALAKAGHTIGGHARSHENLTKLTGEKLMSEIVSDKETIERVLETSVTDFAYPFGTMRHLNAEVTEAVVDTGYTRAYTAVSGFAHPGATFTVPRMCIETGCTPKELRRWVNGGYDLFNMLKHLCAR